MSPKYAKDQPAGFVNRIEKVAIVGAGGNIGGYFVRELLKTGKHTITALTRRGSSTKQPDGVRVAAVDYDDHASLVGALRGQQFLVITLGIAVPEDTESRLIRAAAEAGVAYVMPNVYSPDPANEAMMTQALVGPRLYRTLAEVEALGAGSWVTFASGLWYEWSLFGGAQRFGFDLGRREVTFYDNGDTKITTTTWDQCGRALAALLSLRWLPEDEGDAAPAVDGWANRHLYVSSFRVSQRDMFESVKRATGTADADWEVRYEPSETRFREAHEELRKGDHVAFQKQFYARVFYPTGEGDHSRLGLADKVLGLPQEDLDEATKAGLELSKHRKLYYA